MEKEINLKVNLAGLKLNNPVVVASGTFGSSDEYAKIVDYNQIGAVITKSITLDARVGNKPPRVWETASGMMNAIGLENKGVDHFIEHNIPYFKQFKTKLIVSIAGNTVSDYKNLAQRLALVKGVDALEVNISCPNVKQGGIAFVRDEEQSAQLVQAVRTHWDKTLIVKVSPEARDIIMLVEKVKKAGADVINLINTLKAMAIDIETGKPRLGNVTGGLSGPAIKPVAIRYVYEVKHTCNIPVIGGGGIMNAADAIEFMMAGADAVSLGTVNFVNPRACIDIVDGIQDFCERKKILNVTDIKKMYNTCKG